MSQTESEGRHRSRRQHWTVVVTTKNAAIGKSRLAPYARHRRAELARAMALDTIAAALDCEVVTEVIAVTNDTESVDAFTKIGAVVVPDEPDDGLNAALAYGADVARRRTPGCHVAALQADLPALRPAELGLALSAASAYVTAFVADAASTGTALFCVAPGVPFASRFGPASRNAHLASGAVELTSPGIASVRQDVDTEADLAGAARLGLGPRTLRIRDLLAREPSAGHRVDVG